MRTFAESPAPHRSPSPSRFLPLSAYRAAGLLSAPGNMMDCLRRPCHKNETLGSQISHPHECNLQADRQGAPWSVDFSRIPVHSGPHSALLDGIDRSADHSRSGTLPLFNLRTSDEQSAGTGTQLPLPSAYGWTECKFPGGTATTIFTSGCNKPCTVAHESVHFKDIKPCCDQANIEYLLAPSAEAKERVKMVWNRWVQSARPATECRAYNVSIPCLERLIKEKGCDKDTIDPANKECCGELGLALQDDKAGADQYQCSSTSPAMPKCPFGPSGPQMAQTADIAGS